MEYRIGCMLYVKPGTHVPPGTRYSSGVILKVYNDPELTRWNGSPEIYLEILWVDGHQSTEDIRKVSPYYELIHP